ncbi:MAG: DUF4412 domain-containing protein [Holophagae bacterium]|jgi:hypothetical protein
MRLDRVVALVLVTMLAAGFAAADVKVVQAHHQDGFTMMGQSQPATDEEHVTWLGDRKMRMDQGSTSTVVLLDEKKMYIINHSDSTYAVVDLPVDLNTLLPPGMADQMMKMMQFDVTITATDETKKIGEWNARRYDMKMTSKMMNMDSVLWASKDTPVDVEQWVDLYGEVMRLQPGMQAMIDKIATIDGFIVAQEATMSMSFAADTKVGSSDRVVSIEETDPPAGTYAPPAGSTRKDFNYMEMMKE